jgi:hypothetical protein
MINACTWEKELVRRSTLEGVIADLNRCKQEYHSPNHTAIIVPNRLAKELKELSKDVE